MSSETSGRSGEYTFFHVHKHILTEGFGGCRAMIEDQYAKRLATLSKMIVGRDEIG